MENKEEQKPTTKNGKTTIGLVNMMGPNETVNVEIRRCLGLPQ